MANIEDKYSIDISQYLPRLEQLERAHQKYNKALDLVSISLSKAEKQEQAQVRSINYRVDAVTNLTRVITTNKKGEQTYTDTVRRNNAAQARAAEVARERQAAEKALQVTRRSIGARVGKDVPTGVTTMPAEATAQEVDRYNQAVDRAARVAQKYGLTKAELDVELQKVGRSTARFATKNIELQRALNAADAAAKNLGATARKEAEAKRAAAEAASRHAKAVKSAQQIGQRTLPKEGLTGAPVEQLRERGRAIEQLSNVIDKHKFSQEEVNNIQRRTAREGLPQLIGRNRELAEAIVRVDQANERIKTSLNEKARAHRNAKLATARHTRAVETANRVAQRGIPRQGLTGAPVDRLRERAKAIDQLTQVINKHNFSSQQVTQIQQEMATRGFPQVTGKNRELAEAVHRVDNANQNLHRSMEETNKSMQRISLSGRELVKLIGARLITLVFHRFQLALRQSVQETREFTAALAEVQTIVGEMERGPDALGTIADRMLRISEHFGIPRIDVTRAAYQALSNSMGETTAELENFMHTAARFSTVAATDLESSVNLLSSIINSFGMEVRDAEHVAATLFGAIRVGRMRAEEFANTVGRVTAFAQEMNVTFEETMGALAVMTRSGVRVNEAMTSLNAIMQQIMSPTGELKDLLADMGASSGDVAVRMHGLTGVMERLREEIKRRGSPAFQELLSRIQAIRGAAIFDPEQHAQAMREIEKSVEEYEKVATQRLENVSTQFDKVTQEISNMFQRTFGENIVGSIVYVHQHIISLERLIRYAMTTAIFFATTLAVGQLTKWAGLANGAAQAHRALAGGIKAATGALITKWAWLNKITTALKAKTAAVISLNAAVSALTLGIPVLIMGLMHLAGRSQRIMQDIEEAAQKAGEAFSKNIQETIDAIRIEKLRELRKEITETYQESGKNLKKIRANIEHINERLEVHSEYLESLIEYYGKLRDQSNEWLSILQDDLREVNRILERSQDQVDNLVQSFRLQEFERNIRHIQDPLAQLEARFAAAGQMFQEAMMADDPDFMRQMFREAQNQLTQVGDALFQSGIPQLEGHYIEARQAMQQLFQAQLMREHDLQAYMQEKQARLEHEISIEEYRNSLLEKQVQSLDEFNNLIENIENANFKDVWHHYDKLNANNQLLGNLGIQQNIAWELRDAAKESLRLERLKTQETQYQIQLKHDEQEREQKIRRQAQDRTEMLQHQEKAIKNLTSLIGHMRPERLRYLVDPDITSTLLVKRIRAEWDIRDLRQEAEQLVQSLEQDFTPEKLTKTLIEISRIQREISETPLISRTDQKAMEDLLLSLIKVRNVIRQTLQLQDFRQPVMKRTGGFGVDNVPAYLSRGEFVVNARAAAANSRELKRMNFSGVRRPTYEPSQMRAGGEVNNFNNTNNITLQSSGNETLDGRRIVQAINRAQSRGVARVK